jgi:MipA family protein
MASPVRAQTADENPDRDTFTIGAGGAITPSYDGSDDYKFTPIAAIRGKVSGFSFTTVGPQLFVDVIPDRASDALNFQLGPVAGVRFDRTRKIRDPQVKRLGKFGTPIELGGYVGLSKTGLITSDYDTLSASVAYVHDVAGKHDSYVITPSVSYGTPLSKAIYVGISASANYVGSKYAQRYFGITPEGAVASGLPTYNLDHGWKDVSFGALANYALSGDLRRGFSVFAIGNYSRLMGDFKRSPIVSVAGRPGQWFGGLGLAYTF